MREFKKELTYQRLTEFIENVFLDIDEMFFYIFIQNDVDKFFEKFQDTCIFVTQFTTRYLFRSDAKKVECFLSEVYLQLQKLLKYCI